MNTGSKLGAYALVLGVALGGGALVGQVVGPISVDDDTAGHDVEHAATADTGTPAEAPAGEVRLSPGGYALDADTTTLHAGVAHDLGFRITGPDGATVTDLTADHEGELQLVVVGADLDSYARLHPTRSGGGTWTVELPALDPGRYRAFADFAVTGGPPQVAGVDLTVTGTHPGGHGS
jgi:hypothetical protein